jgi:hypothetical protein
VSLSVARSAASIVIAVAPTSGLIAAVKSSKVSHHNSVIPSQDTTIPHRAATAWFGDVCSVWLWIYRVTQTAAVTDCA